MDSFLEQFINGVYQEAQVILSYLFGYPPYRCTIIKFGGFCYSHNWYGKTSLNYDKVGNLKIYTKTVYFNTLFITKQFNITNHSEYDLPNLANTIAHELSHCLIADYEPKQASEHNPTHAFITAVLEWFIRQTYEFWLLEQLAKMQKKSHPTLNYLKRYSH